MINFFKNSKEIEELQKELVEIKKEVFIEEKNDIYGISGNLTDLYIKYGVFHWKGPRKPLVKKVGSLEEKLDLILNHLKLEIVTKPQEDSKLIIRKAKKQNA